MAIYIQVVQDDRWIASPPARNDGGRLAMTPIYVIARSVATWQSTPTPSLRGAKRRGNPYFRQCRTQDGLLRLRLAMTVGMARNDNEDYSINGCNFVTLIG